MDAPIAIGLISLVVAEGTALVGLFGVLYRRSNHIAANPHNPERTRVGDVSVAYLQGHMNEVAERQERVLKGLERIELLIRERVPRRGE